MNKGKKLVTYWTITGKVRKYEQRKSLSDRLIPFCIILGYSLGCFYIRHYFDNLKSDFVVRATSTEEAPVPSPVPEQGVANNAELDSPKPTTTPTPTKKDILTYIVEKFGDDAGDMITIIRKCENSSFSMSSTNHNRNGTIDYGTAQINSIHIERCGEGIKTDYKANIDCAYDIYERAGKTFRPWTCAHIVGQKNYLGQ